MYEKKDVYPPEGKYSVFFKILFFIRIKAYSFEEQNSFKTQSTHVTFYMSNLTSHMTPFR